MPPPMPMQAHHPYEQQMPSTSHQHSFGKIPMNQQYVCMQNMQQPIPHYPRSPSRVPQPNAHTAQWMNGHYNGGFNGYANSPVPSAAPSVMSHMSMQDDLVSVMSIQTTLNGINVPHSENRLTELRPQSQFSSALTPPCAENVDPATIQSLHQEVAYFINNFFNDQPRIIQYIYGYASRKMFQFVDMASVHKLLILMIEALKSTADHNLRRQNSSNMIDLLLQSFFFFCQHPTTLKVLMHISMQNDFVMIIGHFTRVNGIATLILHYLFDYAGPEGLNCITRAKQNPIVIDSLLVFLRENPSSKYTCYILHSLQLLARNEPNVKNKLVAAYDGFFIDFLLTVGPGGMLTLADLARDGGKLLYRIFALLKVVLATTASAEMLVKCGGLQKVCERLWMSPDVLREGVHLIALASDVKAVDDQDLRISIRQVLETLCKVNETELFTRQHITGFLGNIMANRPVNKRVLVECNGFDILSRLCCLYSRLDEWYEKKDGRRSLEELLDNSLTCIYTLMVEPLSPEQTRSRNLCLRQKTFQISLLNFLSGGGAVVRSRVLKLISLLLDCCEGWASSILQVVDDYKGDNLVGIVFNVISIARASAIEANRKETVVLLCNCLRVLNLIMVREDQSCKMVSLFVRNSPVSMMELLRTFSEDQLVVGILELCDRVADDENLAQQWASDRPLLDAKVNSSNPGIGRAAQSLVGKLSAISSDFEPLAGVFASMGNDGYSMEM